MIQKSLAFLAFSLFSLAVAAQTPVDSLPYPLNENNAGTGGLYMDNPDNVTEEVIFDEKTKTYTIVYKVGKNEIGREQLSFEEYQEREQRKQLEEYWREKENARAKGQDNNSLIPKIDLGEKFGEIFGSSTIDIRPNGTVELIMGYMGNRNDNPSIPVKQRRVGNFNFNQNIQLGVTGKIGDKINLNTNFNTQESFNFNNKMNLKYEGKEDDIIKVIEFGNVSLPLNTTLITGAQSIFGGKVGLQFGRATFTGVFSQQRGKREEINVQGGAQVQKFEVSAAKYEANKHYFLGEYFKQQYDNALKNLPLVNSNIRITRIEVWVTNRINAVENVRNIAALLPLGESSFPVNTAPGTATYPDNNNLPFYSPNNWSQFDRSTVSSPKFQTLVSGQEIEYLNNARLLNPSEYQFNELLGYISLNQPLNTDEVLAVAYQYVGADGKLYQVGEFSTDIPSPNVLMLKLLKSTILNTHQPNWHWMMKNIYPLGAWQISNKDFMLQILYRDVETGALINYLPDPGLPMGVKETPLLRVFNLDRLNQNNDQQPDGFFDFINGLTVQVQGGRIIFPMREPFGAFLREKLGSPSLADKYSFDSLYTTIQTLAELNTERNRFYLGGQYQSDASSEIMLNAINIEKGSVTVTAGGQLLQENVDYTVDYTLGRVKIINQSLLTSGTPIKVSMETNELFNQQQKRLMGGRFDYKLNKHLSFGATIMNLMERPFTQKVNIGDEPINNTIWGFDIAYSKDAPWLTRLIDKIPGINTKAPSRISATGEFAHLIPGYNKVIQDKKTPDGSNKDSRRVGVSQVDDFESAETVLDIRNFVPWKLGSVPHKQPSRFPHAEKFNNLESGYGRAVLTWYNMDPIFFRQQGTPKPISQDKNSRSNNYIREVRVVELFPNLQLPPQQQPNLPILDVNFYPDERGPYNFDVSSLNQFGKIIDPRKSFGSMMRRVETTDWEGANIDYIEFWLMDPFDPDLDQLKKWSTGDNNATNANLLPDGGGDLLIHIGNMSEDIMQDGKFFFENGLAAGNNTFVNDSSSVWGYVPGQQIINQNFSSEPSERELLDSGLDGLVNAKERTHFSSFLNQIMGLITDPNVLDKFNNDPSGDNYRHYVGAYNDDLNSPAPGEHIHDRYRYYQMPEGNSPAENIAGAQTQIPNSEDINNDNTLNQSENYFQYRVSLRKEDLVVGQNFITDARETQATAPNGQVKKVMWYQFRIPVRTEEKEAFGSITDFRSIRFMRLVLNGFPDDVFLRFGRFELVRADWRRYAGDLHDPFPLAPPSQDPAFSVYTVNIEENSQKQPFNYKLPPGITREIDPSNPNLQALNEQSLVLEVKNLPDGVAKGVYKNSQLDLRAYKNMEMFIHAENPNKDLKLGDLTVFIRLGADPNENYYEYEMPVIFSDNNAADKQAVDNIWPLENKMVIPIQEFPELKRLRNQQNISVTQLFTDILENGARISVRGNPNLRDIKTIMIGVRNPFKAGNPFTDQDMGEPVDAQVWVNELRVTDYFEKGGWAAIGRLQAQLADLGNFNASVSYTTAGFGSIDMKPLQRSRDNVLAVDISTNLELAKFTPSKWGLTVPIYVGYGTQISRPQYDPIQGDIRFRDALRDLPDNESRDSLRNRSVSRVDRVSWNLTNVRKNRTSTKKNIMFWDLANFDFTYSYDQIKIRNYQIEYDNTIKHRGILGYTFAPTVPYWEPFKNIKNKSKWLRFLKDFNATLVPKNFTFRNDIQRDYNELLYRNNTDYNLIIEPSYRKNFVWNRTYDFNIAIFKSFNVQYNAIQNSRIDEADGDGKNAADRKLVRDRFFRAGRTTNYTQNFSATYTLPFSKFPATDWMNVSGTYGSSYAYVAGQLLRNQNTGELENPWGNTVSNTNNYNLTANLNFNQLYNKSNYLKNIHNPNWKKPEKKPKKPADPNDPNAATSGKGNSSAKEPKVKDVKAEFAKVDFKKNKAKIIKHKLRTEKVKVRVIDTTGKEIRGNMEIINKNKIKFTARENIKGASVIVDGKRESGSFDAGNIGRFFVGILIGVKNISGTYTQTNGTTLPGYMPNSNFFGQDARRPFSPAHLSYAFGEQWSGSNYAYYAAQQGWLTKDSTLNKFFLRSRTSNLNVSATVEPIKSLRIQLTANRQFTNGSQSLFRFNENAGDWMTTGFMQNGNFSISYNMIRTAFVDPSGGKDPSSALFAQLLNYRDIMSNRLGSVNPNSNGVSGQDPNYSDGYGMSQQDVLMNAFMAAYSGVDPNKRKFDLFPTIPSINWNVTYDGLRNLKPFKKILRNFVLSHGYKSTYTIAGYTNNQLFQEDPTALGFTAVRDTSGNFVPQFILQNVSLMEAFSPLISLDMTWKNSLTTKFEVKKNRNYSLNFQNNQVTHVTTMEYIFGIGYRIEKLRLPFIVAGKRLENDLQLRLDVGVRDNKTTVNRLPDPNSGYTQTVTAGSQNITVKFYADYALSKSVSIRLFYDYMRTNPFMAGQYRTANTNAGISLRLTLTQL